MDRRITPPKRSPDLPVVSHLHVNRPLVVQNSVVVVQNNGKGKTKRRAARAYLFFAN